MGPGPPEVAAKALPASGCAAIQRHLTCRKATRTFREVTFAGLGAASAAMTRILSFGFQRTPEKSPCQSRHAKWGAIADSTPLASDFMALYTLFVMLSSCGGG